MPVPYNVTTVIRNVTTIEDLFSVTNTASNNIAGIGILVGIWFILFLILNREKEAIGIAVPSVIVSILAVFMVSAGMFSSDYIAIPITIAILSVAYLWFGKGTRGSY